MKYEGVRVAIRLASQTQKGTAYVGFKLFIGSSCPFFPCTIYLCFFCTFLTAIESYYADLNVQYQNWLLLGFLYRRSLVLRVVTYLLVKAR